MFLSTENLAMNAFRVGLFLFVALGFAATPVLAKPAKAISFNDLKFEMLQGEKFVRSKLPKEIEALVGKKVVIQGIMWPDFRQNGITQFFLMRNKTCKFGPKESVCHNVVVNLVAGKSTSFRAKVIAVEGVLSVKPLKGPDGNIWSVFSLTATSVK